MTYNVHLLTNLADCVRNCGQSFYLAESQINYISFIKWYNNKFVIKNDILWN